MVLDDNGKQKHVGGALKPHEQPLSANNPSKSFKDHKCKPKNLAKAAAMIISLPASPTTRGAVRRVQEE
eukprot:318395-Pelagomonas_calceolata.AAC.13